MGRCDMLPPRNYIQIVILYWDEDRLVSVSVNWLTIAAHSTAMTSLYAFSSYLELPDSKNNSRNRLSELQSNQDL